MTNDILSGFKAALLIVLGALVIGGVVWAISVGTSDVRGQGDAARAKNAGTNRVAAQERAVQLYNEVQMADKNLDALATDKTSRDGKVRYLGAVNYCNSVVADYNAHTAKYRSREYIPANLPLTINPDDPTTDCKEN